MTPSRALCGRLPPVSAATGRLTLAIVSRDIFVQDLPEGVGSVGEIPENWRPGGLHFGPAMVIDAVTQLVPSADFRDPTWGYIGLAGVDIEVDLHGATEPLQSFALHIRASDADAANALVGRLLERLGVRALDPEGAPETGIFGLG
jgi:hypothetical protein